MSLRTSIQRQRMSNVGGGGSWVDALFNVCTPIDFAEKTSGNAYFDTGLRVTIPFNMEMDVTFLVNSSFQTILGRGNNSPRFYIGILSNKFVYGYNLNFQSRRNAELGKKYNIIVQNNSCKIDNDDIFYATGVSFSPIQENSICIFRQSPSGVNGFGDFYYVDLNTDDQHKTFIPCIVDGVVKMVDVSQRELGIFTFYEPQEGTFVGGAELTKEEVVARVERN